jgi:hypothetical protein
MHVRSAEVSGVQLGFPPQLGVMMTVTIDVYNPNSYDVAIRAMRGQVVFANRYTLPVDFKGPPDGLWLPSDQITPIRVPISIPVPLGMQLLHEAMTNPTKPFHLTGKADVTATRTFQIEKDNYEVDEEGSMSREQVAAAVGSINPFGPH